MTHGTAQTIRWGHSALAMEIALDEDGAARLVHLGTPGEAVGARRPGAPLPLVEVTAGARAGTSSTPTSPRGCGTAPTARAVTATGTR